MSTVIRSRTSCCCASSPPASRLWASPPSRWHAPTSYTGRHSRQSSEPPSARPEPAPRGEEIARPHPSHPGDEQAPLTARPQPARPTPGLLTRRAVPEDGPPHLGSDASGGAPGRRERKPATRQKRKDRKPRASDEVIRQFARRVHEETGRIGRDRVEDALRDAGYTISSDDAGRVVREFKNQLKAAPSDPAP